MRTEMARAFDANRQGPQPRRLIALGAWLTGKLGRLLGLTEVGQRGRVRLHTIALIRWVAVGGQLFTVLFVHFSLGFHLNLHLLLPAIALSALINLVLLFGFKATTRLSERGAGVLFGYDILQLSYLLALTGGLQNPFATLLLLPVMLAAATLGLAATIATGILSLAAIAWLALLPGTLPWTGEGLALPNLLIAGTWMALTLTALLIASYAWWVAEEARRMSGALAATQLALAREQQLSAVGGLAAAAAHELGSPLATINVVAREIVRELPPDSALALEARELLGQVQRCRDILATIGEPRDVSEHETFIRAPLSTLLAELAEEYHRPGIGVYVVVDALHGAPEPSVAQRPDLRHALANLLDNAVQFAESRVDVTILPRHTGLTLLIADDGAGFSPDVLEWLGEPYLSTRHNAGGLGLGVFIASTLLARTGANIQFDNQKRGARVTIAWPPRALEKAFEESLHG